MRGRVMKKAWEIAHGAAEKFGGKVTQYMPDAMRMAWAAERSVDKIAELEGKGFKRWTKGNFDRLYINASQLGLVCTYYSSGNISGAWFQGTKISNSEGRRMRGSKTFVDVKTWRVYSDNEKLSRAAAELAGLAV